MILSIDMSLRSTGWCVINFDGKLVDFNIIKTEADDFPDDEDLIVHLRDEIDMLLINYDEIEQVVIEGLSLNSQSPKKDVIAGAYWALRTLVRQNYPDLLLGSVPVSSWRGWVTTPAERKAMKLICPDHLKNVVYNKLSIDIRERFLKFVVMNGYGHTAAFDLTDAYWLAQYRNSLNK